MRELFIEARTKLNLNSEKLKELEKQLPSTIYIAYSIQFRELAEQVRKQTKKKIMGFSQILGCSKLKTKAEAILLIGQARFHALNLANSSGKEVYVFDNFSISKIGNEEIDAMKKREKGKYTKFLSSNEVGIIISTKPGQNLLNLSSITKELEKQGKRAFLFLADNINLQELENFPLPVYINTACPGLELDSSRIINYKTIQKFRGK